MMVSVVPGMSVGGMLDDTHILLATNLRADPSLDHLRVQEKIAQRLIHYGKHSLLFEQF